MRVLGERVEQVGKGFVASAGHSVPGLRQASPHPGLEMRLPGANTQEEDSRLQGTKVPKAERLGRRVKVWGPQP